MDESIRDRIVERLHANPELAGVPFEVIADDDGLHLALDGVTLATIPADLERRRAARAELKRRCGITLFEADAFDAATPEELEKWLYYDARFRDSTDAVVEWETRRYESRRPHLAALVRDRVRTRMASPFDDPDDIGARIVRALDFAIERVTRPRESEWSGVPVELESSEYWLTVSVDPQWVDDDRLRHRLDSQLRSLTDDERVDAERMLSPEFIDTVAEALTIRWSEKTAMEITDRVQTSLETFGEAFVSPAPNSHSRGERPFREAMAALSDKLSIAHTVVIEPKAAYWRAEDDG